MDFVIGLPVSTNWKGETFASIFFNINQLIKMVHYEPLKVTINALGFAKVIIDIVIRYESLPNVIISNCGSVFTFKFWSSLSYFLRVKKRILKAFQPWRNGQTKQQNSIMETYFQAFVDYEQKNRAKLFLIAKFAYNNA